MRVYNIYHKQERINRTPLSTEDVEKIKSQKFVNKIQDKNLVEQIPVDKIRFVECIMF